VRKSALAEADSRGRVGRRSYTGLTLAFSKISVQVVNSLTTARWNCSPAMLVGSKPSWPSFCLMSGIAATARIASPSFYPWPIHGNFAAVEADLALGRAPALVNALSTAAVGVPVSCCASSHGICSIAPSPAVRQKLSNELSTHCQAASRLGASVIDEGG
jgi:hypothetical protein